MKDKDRLRSTDTSEASASKSIDLKQKYVRHWEYNCDLISRFPHKDIYMQYCALLEKISILLFWLYQIDFSRSYKIEIYNIMK